MNSHIFSSLLVFLPTKLPVAGAGVPQSPPEFSQTFPQRWLTVQNQAAFTGNEMAKGQFTTLLKIWQMQTQLNDSFLFLETEDRG